MKFKFKEILAQLIWQHSSPHEIALGAGIGAFISCSSGLWPAHRFSDSGGNPGACGE